jgi:hypothetical protein
LPNFFRFSGGKLLSRFLVFFLAALFAANAIAQESDSLPSDTLPMENFFDDDSEEPSPAPEPSKQNTEQAEKNKPLPVPEPELPVDDPEIPVTPLNPAQDLEAGEPSGFPEPESDPFSEEIATDPLPGQDVEPLFQEPEEVGEQFTPFDEDPDIQFLQPEEPAVEPEDAVAPGGPESPTLQEQQVTDLSEDSDPLRVEEDIPRENQEDLNINNSRTRIRTGETKIRHPLAPRGLIRITKDKTYVYRTSKSIQDRAISVRGGIFEPSQLENPDTGVSFSDSYSTTQGPIVFFEYEWNWLRGSLGRIGYKLGSGVFTTQGNGQFEDFEDFPENGDRNTPKETFTFAAFPNSASLVYRFQISDKQTVVPYIDGGVMAIAFFELRDDEDFPKVGLAPAAFASGGLAFSLESLDSLAILGLDREYGINDIYFTAEIRQILNVGSKYDFTATAFNGGFLLEF